MNSHIAAGACPRVYLAGPDVFLPDPIVAGDRKKDFCARYGFEGVYPFDDEIDLNGASGRDAGLRISAANEGLIRSCQYVIANVTPFRGPSSDVGTAYEMGFARAAGLTVYAYTNDPTPYEARISRAMGQQLVLDADRRLRDSEGMAVEEWGLYDNLMLDGCIEASGGTLVIVDAPPDQKYTYLAGFDQCLRLMWTKDSRRGSLLTGAGAISKSLVGRQTPS
jgi:nucleoside 2-deoxyribosyltransferase